MGSLCVRKNKLLFLSAACALFWMPRTENGILSFPLFCEKKERNKSFLPFFPNPREFLLLREVQRFLFYPILINPFLLSSFCYFCFLKHFYLLVKQFVGIAEKKNPKIFSSFRVVSANSQLTPPFSPTQPNPDENFPSSSLLLPRGIFTLPQPTFFIFPSIVRKFPPGLFLKWVLSAKEGASSKLCGKAEGAESIVAQNIIRNGCRKILGEKALAVFFEIVKHFKLQNKCLCHFWLPFIRK